ncbi:MAG: mannitol dehydrogenase family protein [Paracoccaceae bacterium]
MENIDRGYEPMKLCNATLDLLPEGIERPNYDRSKLSAGIVHIGLGNFHRAHQAWYLHRLMQQGLDHDWAIIGAGVRSYDATMREKLLSQDCLTTLIELDPSGTSTEITGSMIDYLPIDDDNRSLIQMIVDPSIRIVSLTVTEGGYYIDPVTGGLDESHEDIQHDAHNPSTPKTAFGALVAALRLRRDAGHPAFTGQSCDNLQGNGDILRRTVVSLARMSDPELADWIDTHGAFPNSMVDCIVPATGPQELALVNEMGIDDAAPVTHENFRQWVIEDQFACGRPDWGQVGATLTDNVHAYEAMKIRILNAGHQVLANAGELLSIPSISGCMGDADISAFFSKVQNEDILPFVAEVPNLSSTDYLKLIEGRFANPAILDTTRRVAFDGSSRHTGFVIPTINDALAAEGSIAGLALVEALWARMCEGTREDGSDIEPNDPYWDQLKDVASQARHRPVVWLEQAQYYGELVNAPPFVQAFEHWLNILWDQGTRAALTKYAAS